MSTVENGREENGQFAEGNPGRPMGTENKLTARAKHYANKLFDEFERMGIDKMAQTGDVKDLINLISKFVPKEIKSEGTITVTLRIKYFTRTQSRACLETSQQDSHE